MTRRVLRGAVEGMQPRRFSREVLLAAGMGRGPDTFVWRALRAFGGDDLVASFQRGTVVTADRYNGRYLYVRDPRQRCILPLDAFHVGATLSRVVRNTRFDVRIDSAFMQVVELCAEPAADRPITWLARPLQLLYADLFERGIAHSVEVWDGDTLVGGLFGVQVGGVFSCESLVTRADHASKIALVHLVARLNAGGFSVLDMQELSDHFRRFGGIEIPRDDYKQRIRRAHADAADFFALPSGIDGRQALALAKARAGGPADAPAEPAKAGRSAAKPTPTRADDLAVVQPASG